ncbi:MAG: cytoplasmic protein [Thermoplasmata archaeon]|nr:MAG: cytoplasmic protein [Deltaproteobacteria bacterium]RLF53686.1 MAG: cytoplasmic protein [Thermoplasmata archaeon]HDZ24478.1 cytoplasmic protein [Desulfobacteraceae bacterium]
MKKFALFAYNGDFMCFIHVLLNALDMKERGHEVKLVIEGSATKLVPELAKKDNPMHQLYEKTKAQGLIEGVCKACSNKMGSLDAVKAEGLPLLDEMVGHPSIARYYAEGFEVVTF